jgi:hypothetical protein
LKNKKYNKSIIYCSKNLNNLTKNIVDFVFKENKKIKRNSISIKKDISIIESVTNAKMDEILANPAVYIKKIMSSHSAENGISASIQTCLVTYEDTTSRVMLRQLLRTTFQQDMLESSEASGLEVNVSGSKSIDASTILTHPTTVDINGINIGDNG